MDKALVKFFKRFFETETGQFVHGLLYIVAAGAFVVFAALFCLLWEVAQP